MWEPPALPVQATPGQLTPSRTIPGHTDIMQAVAFFKDGRRIVTGSTDCALQIWDMQTGVLVEGPFKGHKDGAFLLLYSRHLLTAVMCVVSHLAPIVSD
ncbi:hypothetical protein BDR04DRAFT_1032235 [Suillus decipiens]|nr:hypothetical protein BDR04DRAFT_1032235 [Suillus decipiens]